VGKIGWENNKSRILPAKSTGGGIISKFIMAKNIKIIENSEKLLKQLTDLSEERLAQLVTYHNKKYFEENNPEITDEAFDKLVEALRFINPDSESLSQIGHKDETDSTAKFGDIVVHSDPMLSLEKCYDDGTFHRWAKKIMGDFIAMPKIDGVACSIKYSYDGKLLKAATRGDGRSGEDVTKNALLIADLPGDLNKELVKSIISNSFLEIRGEIFLPLGKFNEMFANDFTSPRNLAAGILKLKEGDRTKNNYLKFFPYDLRGSNANSEKEKFDLLKHLGFSMMPWWVVKNDAQATKIYNKFLQNRNSFDYEIDGVVFRANSLADQMRLGETAHHPRYALAYKFQGESAQTRLIKVEWSVARSGIITPIAIVEPVFVSQARVSRASLHNIKIFFELDLREQSLVEIVRRGGVIPYLERVLSKKGPKISIPHRCPSCSGPIIIDKDFLRCQNPSNCQNVLVSRIVHFCHSLNIEGLGEKIVRKLVEARMVKKFGDIFRLNPNALSTLERMGQVLASKLVDEIKGKQKIELATFIKALGIPEIGSNISELVANNFYTLAKIRKLEITDLLPIHGIGKNIATSLIEGLKEYAHEIDDLLQIIEVKEENGTAQNTDSSHPLFGCSVVFTGKMAHLERKSAQKEVKKYGGKTPGAISGNIDILVIGDDGSPLLGAGQKSTKQKEAEKLINEGHKLKIISESEFLKLLQK
jgi:DNA ligase (NAD+)